MTSGPETDDVIVIGGGVIGLSVGWRAASAGMRVTVCDPSPGRGASWVAAGMLAPVAESRVAEGALVDAGLASLARWPSFAEELAQDARVDVGLRREGTLEIAFDDDDRRAVDELADAHRSLGLESSWCTARECRLLEPMLSPSVRGGLRIRGDWQVDPRAVVTALAAAFAHRGGHLRLARANRVLVRPGGRAVVGVELDDGSTRSGGMVVVAAGAHSAALPGIPAGAVPPVRPVKGEILRLRADPSRLPFDVNLRASVRGRPVYLVARRHGEIVVGATVQECGFDTTIRTGAVHDLLHDAIDVVPVLQELPLVEATAELRPGTPDNAPVLGTTPVPGVVLATGHYRQGVLLAPFTADAILGVLSDGRLPPGASAFGLGRFG